MSQAPQSKTDICNLALDHCGEGDTIQDIDDPTNENEELLARHYDNTRRTCLREFVWNFAQGFRELARNGDGSGGYADAYNLPADFVRLNFIGENRQYPVSCGDYEIVGKTIWIDNGGGTLSIWYNKDITEVALMDALFINYLSLRLAEMVAYQITKKKSVVDRISEMIKMAEPKATSVDGQERRPRRVQHSRYLAARRRGGNAGRNPQFYQWD